MNRRDFIYSSSVISSAALVGVNKAKKRLDSTPPSGNYVLARSGNYKRDNFYLLGVMIINDPETITRRISDLKDVHRYRTKISYNTNDKFKLPIAKDLIDLFLDERVELKSLLEVPSGVKDTTSSFKLKMKAIERILGNNFNSSLTAKNESYYSPSTQMKENFNSSIGGRLVTERTDDSLLLQFADLINGCVYGAIHNKVKSRIKLELINHFKQRIGIDYFTKGVSKQDKLYII